MNLTYPVFLGWFCVPIFSHHAAFTAKSTRELLKSHLSVNPWKLLKLEIDRNYNVAIPQLCLLVYKPVYAYILYVYVHKRCCITVNLASCVYQPNHLGPYCGTMWRYRHHIHHLCIKHQDITCYNRQERSKHGRNMVANPKPSYNVGPLAVIAWLKFMIPNSIVIWVYKIISNLPL